MLLVSAVPMTASAEPIPDYGSFYDESQNVAWSYSGNGISRCGPKDSNQYHSWITVPWHYTNEEGDERIFLGIGGEAFSHIAVSKIAMGNYSKGKWNTWSVGSDVLKGSAVSSVILGGGPIYIKKWAFRNSILAYIWIQDNVASIGEEAFLNTKITLNYLNDTITTIGKGAFKDCISLRSFIIPRSISRIEESTFDGCINLQYAFLEDNIEYIGSRAFADTAIEQIFIPASVTEIADDAFGTKLETIYGEEGTYAQSWAYSHGYSFVKAYDYTVNADNTVTITECKLPALHYFPETLGGKTVARIGAGAFQNTEIINGKSVVHNWAETTLIRKAQLNENIRYIGEGAFCNADIELNLNGDAVIEEDAFENDSTVDLTVVGDKDIANNFFKYGCVANLTITGGIKKVGDYAFYGNEKLKKVTIPASVTQIGNYAFGYTDYHGKPKKIDGFVIRGYRGSAAAKYAEANGITFEPIDDVITSVSVTGVTKPVAGNSPSYSAAVAESFGYQISNTNNIVTKNGIGWFNMTDSTFLFPANNDQFEEGKEYGVFISLETTSSDYQFSDEPSATVNGIPATISAKGKSSITVFYVFSDSVVILGDADGDGKVTIYDASAIQKQIAGMNPSPFVVAAADADGDGIVTVYDASAIQKYIAEIPAPAGIGKPI